MSSMVVFRWSLRRTKQFGDVWVPLAEVELEGPTGIRQAFALMVDSGAVITLLRRSVADLLGIDHQRGKAVSLGGVGGARTTARLHEINLRFRDELLQRAPVAIADDERVPNLLGRFGLFESLRIAFDGESKVTTFSALSAARGNS